MLTRKCASGATRSNHHLPLLILCVKFVILAAGDAPKKSAPNLVSIMFTEDDGDFKVQVAVSELESPVDGQGVSTANSDLNVVMGSTIFQGKTDLPANNIQELRRLIQNTRYDFLENESGYKLPGRDVGMKVCIFSAGNL